MNMLHQDLNKLVSYLTHCTRYTQILLTDTDDGANLLILITNVHRNRTQDNESRDDQEDEGEGEVNRDADYRLSVGVQSKKIRVSSRAGQERE